MNAKCIANSLLVSLIMISIVPAWAEGGTADPAGTPNLNNSSPKKSKSASSSSLAELPKKTLGFLSGCIVGLPVCAVRNPIADEKYTISQWTGDSDQKRLTIPAGIFWFPFAVASGVSASPLSAIKHSAQHFNEPFSKEQFSLGEREAQK